jgi:acyl carrier protein
MTASRIIQIVAEALSENHPMRVQPEVDASSSFEDLHADPLDVMSITDRIEQEFGFIISDETAKKFLSVQDIIDIVGLRARIEA